MAVVSDKNDTGLVLACLNDAISGHPYIRGAIHHTDTDVHYCSAPYVARAMEIELTMSMTVGNVYEKVYAKSLNNTYKRQEINVSDYGDKFTVAESLFRFKGVHNTSRPHSSIGLPPLSVFRKNFERKRAERDLQA